MNPENEWVSVSTPYLTPRSTDAWAQEGRQHGGKATQRLLEVRPITPPAQVAKAFTTEPGEDVVVRRRIMLFDGQPVELTDSYYPSVIAAGTRLAEPRKIPGGSITLLAELGYPPRHVTEDVSARPATARERQLLDLAEGDWVLVLVRVTKTAEGRPVEASVMTMIAKYRHLRYELTV